MAFFENLQDKKERIQKYNGIRPLTPLFNDDDDFYLTKQPGGKITYANPESFFTPFHSMSDFGAQLKAPFAMFIVDVTVALAASLYLLKHLLLFVVELATLDLHNAEVSLKHAAETVCDTVYFSISAITDPLWQLAALATRTAATVVSGVESVVDAVSPSY